MIVVRRSGRRGPERVQQEMEQVFRSLVPSLPGVAAPQGGLWRPALEVYETEQALVVLAEIAGLDERRLDVVVDQNVLSIRGERPDSRPAEKRSYHEAGIAYGAFGADVYVPFPIDVERTTADYTNGFLRIVLPRAAPRKLVPRRQGQTERDQGAR